MTTTGSTLQNLRSCSICLENYSTGGLKVPKMLECLHTFCFECLGRLVTTSNGNLVSNNNQSKILCPICRTETKETPDNLPTNTLAVRMLNAQHNPRNETTNHVFQVLKSSLENHERVQTALEVLDSDLQISKQFNAEHLRVALQCFERYRIDPNRDYAVETACSSFIAHLLQFSSDSQIPSATLTKVASEAIKSMDDFEFGEDLRDNCVSILQCNCVLNGTVFDYSKTFEILIQSILSTSSLPIIHKVLVFLLSLTDKMTSSQKKAISILPHIQTLLQFIREQLTSNASSQEIGSAIKLVSDMVFQRPTLRHTITEVDELETLRRLLKTNCVYEEQCRKNMLRDVSLLESLRHLLRTNFAVKYAAAFVLSGLLQESSEVWVELARSVTLRDIVSTELYTAVLSWNASVKLGITFSGMGYFATLLRNTDTPSIQLFAAWSVYRLCSQDESYRSMVISGDCVQALSDCTETASGSPEDTKKLAELTLKLLLK